MSAISFKRELEALRMQRKVPLVERHLTIGGGIQAAVDRQVDQQRERRIGVLETHFAELKGRAEAEFTFAELQGRTTRAFDHSR